MRHDLATMQALHFIDADALARAAGAGESLPSWSTLGGDEHLEGIEAKLARAYGVPAKEGEAAAEGGLERREEGGERVIGEERAQVIPHHEVQVPTRKGDPGDACRLLGDGWKRLWVQ